MICLFIGKKGTGKSAAMRKVMAALLASEPRPLLFSHDPHGQIRGCVFDSVASWRAARIVPPLSIFRTTPPDEVTRLALEVADVSLFLDELDLVSANKEWRAPNVRHTVHYGRHYRVNLFGGFRRTANVPEDILAMADHVFLFRHDPAAVHDLRAVRDRFGEAAADAVQRLEPMRFLHLEGSV